MINRLKAAETAARATDLCKIFVWLARKFTAALTGLVGKAKSGGSTRRTSTAPPVRSPTCIARRPGRACFADNANANRLKTRQ